MQKFSTQLYELYTELSNCLKNFHQTKLNIEALKTVNKIAHQALNLANHYPDPFFAQLHLPKKKYTFRVNLTFNCLCLTLLLGKRLKWNESSLQQLICASITSFSFKQALLERVYTSHEKNNPSQLNQPDSRLLKLTSQTKQDLWYSGALNGNHAHLEHDKDSLSSLGYHPLENQILFVARWLSLRLAPNVRFPRQSFPDVIKQLTQSLPSSCHSLIAPLLSYPSLYAPGTLIKSANGILYWILSVSQNKLIVKQYDNANRKISDQSEVIAKQQLDRVFPAKVIANFSEIDLLWDDGWSRVSEIDDDLALTQPFSPSYKIDKPPAILMAIQDQLNKREVDLAKVCQLVEKETAFMECLKITASHSSRKKLPIQDIKHAIMLHGFGRTQSILTQQALSLRLSQNNFPLQVLLNQVTTITKSFAEHIADNVPSILPQEASTFVSFVCASLFTELQYKRMIYTPGVTDIELIKLINPIKNERFLIHSQKLAASWQQGNIASDALNIMRGSKRDTKIARTAIYLASIAQLSLSLSRSYFLSSSKVSYDEEVLITQHQKTLNLNSKKLKNILEAATSGLSRSLPSNIVI